ncbi:MAG: outer membrane beta-barrel protein, partial [Dinghuibacter sp.]|nr:outer membrane beta-barrel protein [Dinghuibacter sp.]
MESTPANKPGNPATPIQTNQQRLAASVIPVQSQENNVVNTTSNNEQMPVQNNNPLRTGKNQPPVHTTPRLLTVRTVQEKKVKRLPLEPDAEQADAEFLWEVNPVLNNNSNETAVRVMEEEVVPDNPLAIQSPILHQVPDAPVLAALTTQEVQTPFSIKAITIKPRLPKRPVYFGIRTGWVLNHTGWAAKKQPLFPQRLLPLEFYIEQPLNRKMSLELGVNLFSSRNIQYGLQRQESGTDAATGRFHLRNEKYTAQALHFTDVQLLLHRNSNSNWRLHGGVYFSVLKNIAVEVNRYDSVSKPTPTGSSFESTTTTGYTYARKLNEVNLVAPFRKSDMGLLAGIGYRGKLWEAGLSTQVGL